MEQVIDHDVPDEMDLLRPLPFTNQIRGPALFRNEKAVADRIGHHAVNLFRHGHIKTSESGLDMRYLDHEFFCNDAARKRGIDVPDNKYPVRLLRGANLLESRHD